MSIDPYDHVICIKYYYRDLLVKMPKFAFLGVYVYTLYQQIRDLSTYSHLITVLYKKHALELMTSALYADLQAIVKNIIFTVVRLQLLDPDMDSHILFEGTDHLENVFSHVQTQDYA